jgi:hypothetical protein
MCNKRRLTGALYLSKPAFLGATNPATRDGFLKALVAGQISFVAAVAGFVAAPISKYE